MGMVLFISVNLFAITYESLIIKSFSPLTGYNQIVQRGTSFSRMFPYHSLMDETVYDDLSTNPDFSAAEIYPVYFKRIYEYSDNKSMNQNILFGLPYSEMDKFFTDLEIEFGGWPGTENETVIGNDLMDEFGFQVADTISVKGKNYTISGILGRHESLFDGLILVDLTEVQTILGVADQLTSIYVRYVKSIEELMEPEVESNYLDLEFLTLDEINEVTGNLLDRAHRTSLVFMILTIFCSVLFTTSIIFLNVHDRKREIATLRSIGAPNRQIFKLIYGEVIIIALIALIGIPIGITTYSLLTYKFMNVTGYLEMSLTRSFVKSISSITWQAIVGFFAMHFGSSLIMAGIPYYLIMKNDIQSEIRGN